MQHGLFLVSINYIDGLFNVHELTGVQDVILCRFFDRQMNSTWLFASAQSKWYSKHQEMKEFTVNLGQKSRRKLKGMSGYIVEEALMMDGTKKVQVKL
ncbi:hypothetical protein LR48_Vigan62s000900 [Vigna angularis]|uniref:Uncharacterized protein n=1 Tax=Phaseolus angularis TaxID=3914 RepID=A0A0L9T3S8_PHAAN|nr:hypothetical protein LR48_Vigan62s000900 [Vigna angularis]